MLALLMLQSTISTVSPPANAYMVAQSQTSAIAVICLRNTRYWPPEQISGASFAVARVDRAQLHRG